MADGVFPAFVIVPEEGERGLDPVWMIETIGWAVGAVSQGARAGATLPPPLATVWPASPGRGLPKHFSSLPGCSGRDWPPWYGWDGQVGVEAGSASGHWRTSRGTGPITECEGERAGPSSPGPASACGRVQPGSQGRSWPSRCRGLSCRRYLFFLLFGG